MFSSFYFQNYFFLVQPFLYLSFFFNFIEKKFTKKYNKKNYTIISYHLCFYDIDNSTYKYSDGQNSAIQISSANLAHSGFLQSVK